MIFQSGITVLNLSVSILIVHGSVKPNSQLALSGLTANISALPLAPVPVRSAGMKRILPAKYSRIPSFLHQ
jgi:hypothetical protein